VTPFDTTPAERGESRNAFRPDADTITNDANKSFGRRTTRYRLTDADRRVSYCPDVCSEFRIRRSRASGRHTTPGSLTGTERREAYHIDADKRIRTKRRTSRRHPTRRWYPTQNVARRIVPTIGTRSQQYEEEPRDDINMMPRTKRWASQSDQLSTIHFRKATLRNPT
jgi:hypothetical protein